MFTKSLESALHDFEDMKAGKRIVTNDETLDVLMSHFTDKDTDDSRLFYESVSMPNPAQLGVLDQYVAWIPSREAVKQSEWFVWDHSPALRGWYPTDARTAAKVVAEGGRACLIGGGE